MSCNILCNNFIISTSVQYADNELVVQIPSGSYADNRRICLVIAQTIPNTTTINAAVKIQVGSGAVLYDVINRNGLPLLAKSVRSRVKYPMIVQTGTDTGVFRLINGVYCPTDTLAALNGDGAPVVTAEGE